MKSNFWKHQLRLISISAAIAIIVLVSGIALYASYGSVIIVVFNLITFCIIVFSVIALVVRQKQYFPTRIGYNAQKISYEKHETKHEIDFPDIRRIEYSQYPGAFFYVITEDGEKTILGPGYGGNFSNSIIDSYTKWAESNKIILTRSDQTFGFHRYSIIDINPCVVETDIENNIATPMIMRFLNTPVRIRIFLFSFTAICLIILITGILFNDYLSIFFGALLLFLWIFGLYYFKEDIYKLIFRR